MQDLLDDPRLDEEQEQKAMQRNQKYLARYWKQPMSPGKGKNDDEVPGVWIQLPGHHDPTYVNQEAHIKRLLLEHGGQVVNDPRPGAVYIQPRAIDGVPAGQPPEPPEHIQKIHALERDVSSLKEGMNQILSLLQAKSEPEEQSSAKSKR